MSVWTPAAAARLRMAAREAGRQDELVERSGVPRATFQRILAGKTDPGPDRLQRICDAIGESVDYILTGRREGSGNVVEVPINDIQVSAGPGRFALDEDQRIGSWPLPSDWVTEHFGNAANLRFVRVSGDSQEPELRDGDMVLIDLSANKLAEGMHVVGLDDSLLIKRVQIEGARVRLKSANQSYDDIIVDLGADQERFRVVAKAAWTMKALGGK
ncbi:MAG TPA: XRE family transcriptional regulator [Sphingomonas sp.]|nr:XRE family transcriptional regulator [Sphingomonas sp.]